VAVDPIESVCEIEYIIDVMIKQGSAVIAPGAVVMMLV
jgi:hypothetical protein